MTHEKPTIDRREAVTNVSIVFTVCDDGQLEVSWWHGGHPMKTYLSPEDRRRLGALCLAEPGHTALPEK